MPSSSLRKKHPQDGFFSCTIQGFSYNIKKESVIRTVPNSVTVFIRAEGFIPAGLQAVPPALGPYEGDETRLQYLGRTNKPR